MASARSRCALAPIQSPRSSSRWAISVWTPPTSGWRGPRAASRIASARSSSTRAAAWSPMSRSTCASVLRRMATSGSPGRAPPRRCRAPARARAAPAPGPPDPAAPDPGRGAARRSRVVRPEGRLGDREGAFGDRPGLPRLPSSLQVGGARSSSHPVSSPPTPSVSACSATASTCGSRRWQAATPRPPSSARGSSWRSSATATSASRFLPPRSTGPHHRLHQDGRRGRPGSPRPGSSGRAPAPPRCRPRVVDRPRRAATAAGRSPRRAGRGGCRRGPGTRRARAAPRRPAPRPHLVERDRPGGRHPLLVAAPAGPGRTARRSLPGQPQVVGRGRPVSPRHRPRPPRAPAAGRPRNSARLRRARLVPGWPVRRAAGRIDSWRRSTSSGSGSATLPPRAVSGGDQHVPRPARRQQRLISFGRLGVVVDQQPVVAPAQLVEQLGHHLVLIGPLLDAELPGQRGQGGHGGRGPARRGSTR